MMPPAAAGDVNRDGTAPRCCENNCFPDDASSATRVPSFVATAHTAPFVTMVGPGTDRFVLHPTLKSSPVTITWTTAFEHGTNAVPPSWARPPNADVLHTRRARS